MEFEIKQNSEGWEGKFCCPKDLIFYNGHFPEKPILPGFYCFEICRKLVSEILKQNMTLKSAPKAKFLNIIEPSDILHFKVRNQDPFWKIDFIKSDKKIAVQMKLSFF